MNTLPYLDWLQHLSQARGVFVTGTDTGVGKTYVGTRLLTQLRTFHLNIQPRKPAESGWPDDVTQTDAWQLLQAAHLPPEQLAKVCPYRLKAALSPARAAQLENKILTIADLKQACIVAANEWLYVEGAGGFYSPLAQDGLNADLAQALQLPVVLVAEDKLGCLNQILLSAAAIQARGLTLAGVLLNPLHPTPATMDNLTELQVWLDVPSYRFKP